MDSEEWAERKKKERLADSVKQIQRSIDEHKKSPLYKTGKPPLQAVSNPITPLVKMSKLNEHKLLAQRYETTSTDSLKKEISRVQEIVNRLYSRISDLEKEVRPLQLKLDEWNDVLNYRSREVVLCEIDEKAAKLMIPALEAMGKRVKIIYADSKFKPCKIIELVTE